MQNIIPTLIGLGFSEKESRAYIALLELGEATAYVVAQKANLKKPTAQFVLDQLVKKGVSLKIPAARHHRYLPKSPEEILAIHKNLVSDLSQAMPLLRALFKTVDTSTKVFFYEGITEIEKALWYKIEEMRETEFIAFYGSAKTADKPMLGLIDAWNEALLKQSTSCRAIVPDHPSLKKHRDADAKFRRHTKIVPYEKYPSNYSIEITQSFVRILMIGEKKCVIIENPELAKTLTHIFELVWTQY